MGIESHELQIDFGSNHKEGQALRKDVKTAKVEISAIHDVEGTWFGDKIVQDIDIVYLAVCDPYK